MGCEIQMHGKPRAWPQGGKSRQMRGYWSAGFEWQEGKPMTSEGDGTVKRVEEVLERGRRWYQKACSEVGLWPV